MKDSLLIFLGLLGIVVIGFACIAFPYIILPLAGIVGLLWWLMYSVVKTAVKDALREYDEEKAKANGQK